MSIPSSSPQMFGWVKPVLTESMTDVKNRISVAASSEDTSLLGKVTKNLHQIQGSLHMVELEAARMFADDLGALSARLANGEIEDVASPLETLRRGVERLELYLSAIDRQTPISPLALMDEMNQVRQLAGMDALTRFDLFDPPLRFWSMVPVEKPLPITPDKRHMLLLGLQKRFRQALRAWLLKDDPGPGLDMMKEVLQHLQRVGGPDICQQLWWVASGFVEAIRSGMILTDGQVKSQLAQIDREISRMIESPFSEIANTPPDDLLRRMLYLIGDSSTDESDDAVARYKVQPQLIREMLGLDQWFTFDINALSNPYAEYIESVRALAREMNEGRIALLEDQLDLYFSGLMKASQEAELLGRMETLDECMRKYEPEIFAEFSTALLNATRHAGADRSQLLVSGADIKVASALLFLKQTLDDADSIGEAWVEAATHRIAELRAVTEGGATPEIEQLSQQDSPEYRDARDTVVAEIRKWLSEIETTLTENWAQNAEQMPRKLKELGQWFTMLNEETISTLCKELEALVAASLDADAQSEAVTEHYPFVVASIGVCVDFVAQGSAVPGEIVDKAKQVLVSMAGGEVPEPEPVTAKDDNEAAREQTSSPFFPVPDPEAEQLYSDPPIARHEETAPVQAPATEDVAAEDLVSNDMDPDASGEDAAPETILDQIDHLDRTISSFQSDSTIADNASYLSLLFTAIEESVDTHLHQQTHEVAALGRVISDRIAESEVECDFDVVHFLGQLSQQLDTLENAPDGDFADDVQRLQARFAELVPGSDPVAAEVPAAAEEVAAAEVSSAASAEAVAAEVPATAPEEVATADEVSSATAAEAVAAEVPATAPEEVATADEVSSVASVEAVAAEVSAAVAEEVAVAEVPVTAPEEVPPAAEIPVEQATAEEGEVGVPVVDDELKEIFLNELDQHADALRSIAENMESQIKDEET